MNNCDECGFFAICLTTLLALGTAYIISTTANMLDSEFKMLFFSFIAVVFNSWFAYALGRRVSAKET